MDNLNELLFSFKQHLQAHGRSPATVDLYTDQARCFLQTVAADDIKTVSKSDIETYIEGLYDHKTDKGKPLHHWHDLCEGAGGQAPVRVSGNRQHHLYQPG